MYRPADCCPCQEALATGAPQASALLAEASPLVWGTSSRMAPLMSSLALNLSTPQAVARVAAFVLFVLGLPAPMVASAGTPHCRPMAASQPLPLVAPFLFCQWLPLVEFAGTPQAARLWSSLLPHISSFFFFSFFLVQPVGWPAGTRQVPVAETAGTPQAVVEFAGTPQAARLWSSLLPHISSFFFFSFFLVQPVGWPAGTRQVPVAETAGTPQAVPLLETDPRSQAQRSRATSSLPLLPLLAAAVVASCWALVVENEGEFYAALSTWLLKTRVNLLNDKNKGLRGSWLQQMAQSV